MRLNKLKSKLGQSSVEYIMLVAMVTVAVFLFFGPIGRIIASSIKEQKDVAEQEYTDGQKNEYKEYYERAGVVKK